MLKQILILFLFFVGQFYFAQTNLVPNPSFEFTVNCPTGTGQIVNAQGWNSPTNGTPDYFNSCASNTNVGTPYNIYGYRSPKTGFAYAGLVSYLDNSSNYSEYIQCQLSSSLSPSQQYCISFYVNLADSSLYSSNDIGVYLSVSALSLTTNQSLTMTPAFSNTSVNIDKTNWNYVIRTYTASGGEQFLIIGNFKNNSSTSVFPSAGATWMNGVYFYIDDVAIVQGQCTTSINENALANLKVYPNPSNNGVIYLDLRGINIYFESFKILDILGNEIEFKGDFFNPIQIIDLSAKDNGIYFLKFKCDSQEYIKKIIINKQ